MLDTHWILTLVCLPKFGIVSCIRFLDIYQSDPQVITNVRWFWLYALDVWERIYRVQRPAPTMGELTYASQKASDILQFAMDQNIHWINYTEELYPETLRTREAKAPILFYKGDIDYLQRRLINIVCTEPDNSWYDDATENLIRLLNHHNFNTISSGHTLMSNNADIFVTPFELSKSDQFPANSTESSKLMLSHKPPFTPTYNNDFDIVFNILVSIAQVTFIMHMDSSLKTKIYNQPIDKFAIIKPPFDSEKYDSWIQEFPIKQIKSKKSLLKFSNRPKE